ncbi:Metallo-dependent phosphatase-like protein [Mycena maculata]|uniref:Metallo-dependent phosphatase-like protein n=1 Tax=Mycena maculata TaxID=230809 RepID=A0AAD7HE65_9AGAR|nr:Metallo-dependent phosphatase-like protein [Mycena maculata]
MPTLALPHRTIITSRTSVVQLEYSSETGPLPKPDAPAGAHYTRFVLLSDTHTRTCPVPDGDVLLHAGDLTQNGTLKELHTTMEWLYALPHPIKIMIAGNHDSAIHREWYEANWKDIFLHRSKDEPESAVEVLELLKGPRAVATNLVYLEDEEYKFKAWDGGREWSVYGSPWSPNFGVWAFGYDREDGDALVAKFPKTDILLTHGPPRNVLDLTNTKDRTGCSALAERVPELKPKLHVFGHIHEARGAYLHRWKPETALLGVQNYIQLGIKRDGVDATDADEGEEDAEEFEEYSDESDGDGVDYGPLLFDDPGIAEESTGTVDGGVIEEEETIFVNAANWPSGPNARRTGMRVKMGGQGFQPIIVDLLDQA